MPFRLFRFACLDESRQRGKDSLCPLLQKEGDLIEIDPIVAAKIVDNADEEMELFCGIEMGKEQSRLFLEVRGGKKKTAKGDLKRSEERRVGKECRSRWSPYH